MMNKIIIICNETKETRSYENCRFLSENITTLNKLVTDCNGNWSSSFNMIQITIASEESFHKLVISIESLQQHSLVEANRITITLHSDILCTFKETPYTSKMWNEITREALLLGGQISGKSINFKCRSCANSFIDCFCDYFIK